MPFFQQKQQQQQQPQQFHQHQPHPQQQQYSQPPQDAVSGEQYRYALANFRIAHEKVEQQRIQLEEQEKQIALLRTRITSLEGGSELEAQNPKQGGSSVDDFSIKNAASRLEKLINRWAADVVRQPPVPLENICQAIIDDLPNSGDVGTIEASQMRTQNLLRHALAEAVSEGIINCLVVTNSSEANVQLTRIHEHLFARDPTVACVWRRQTFSASVENCTPEMGKNILQETIPSVAGLFGPLFQGPLSIIYSAYNFSRVLHGSNASSGGVTDAFYRAFVPELGAPLNPHQVELVKRCLRSERGELDRVGSTVFPGLVKVTRGNSGAGGSVVENVQNVIRRAQVVCECALTGEPTAYRGSTIDEDKTFTSPTPGFQPSMNDSPIPAGGSLMAANGTLLPGASMIPGSAPYVLPSTRYIQPGSPLVGARSVSRGSSIPTDSSGNARSYAI